MNKMRVVSFLPAATEMMYALGIGDQLVGISHECDFPSEARGKPVVVRPALELEKLNLREIDVAVAERIRNGLSLYQVDEKVLCDLRPDLILAQDLCQVCATSGNDLSSVLKSLQRMPEILWMTPHSLTAIFENIRELGKLWRGLAKRTHVSMNVGGDWEESLSEPRIYSVDRACSAWNGPIQFIAQDIGYRKWLNSQAARMNSLAGGLIPCASHGRTS